ncbi:hypothetical protein PITCH_A420078 [uncultured Desulfobacterium sp.]|uniref:Uncharacterized protein n=1 Tax=uncultured Desulfobacterium sp. TaxID=201089 RepID=A0A445N072_9BACT|nr:hypothetical protein PITCH_A420078 [uncultured Desulfobacterium sp.]
MLFRDPYNSILIKIFLNDDRLLTYLMTNRKIFRLFEPNADRRPGGVNNLKPSYPASLNNVLVGIIQ